jgi:hypothetical protein
MEQRPIKTALIEGNLKKKNGVHETGKIEDLK